MSINEYCVSTSCKSCKLISANDLSIARNRKQTPSDLNNKENVQVNIA